GNRSADWLPASFLRPRTPRGTRLRSRQRTGETRRGLANPKLAGPRWLNPPPAIGHPGKRERATDPNYKQNGPGSCQYLTALPCSENLIHSTAPLVRAGPTSTPTGCLEQNATQRISRAT